MKITVDISEKDLKDVMRFTGEKKKGPAIARLLADTLMLKRRRELSDEVKSGKVRFEFPTTRPCRNSTGNARGTSNRHLRLD